MARIPSQSSKKKWSAEDPKDLQEGFKNSAENWQAHECEEITQGQEKSLPKG